ncbi:phage late control D family protein [Dongia sp.]|uniref:phage late control D family protein n=1 Tax=Dongia sp. TaxID=1977262 RepID=UPI0037505058
MDISDASRTYGAFYVPAFAIKVSGKDLVRELGIGVSQVEVDLTLGAAGRFSFTVVHTYDMERRAFLYADGQPLFGLLKFGAQVEIGIGYGDATKLKVMLQGVITEITTGFSESGAPELSVAGYDHLFPMTLGKRSQSWTDQSDSDVIAKLAKAHNLQTAIEPTAEKHPQIEQNQESDFEFVKKLAERNHFEFYVDQDKRLRFGPPHDKDDGIITLRWGESLLSFKPEVNLAAQVSTVEVYGWDPDTKKPIVGRAVAGEESGHDAKGKSGGERVKTALGIDPVLQLRQPVFTEAEAKRRAQAVLNDHAKRFLTGEAECIGLPELRPDRNVVFGNLGEPFSKTYYIQQTTHKADSGGYRARLKVKESTI